MAKIRMSKIVMQEQMNQREGIGEGGKESPDHHPTWSTYGPHFKYQAVD
jgi:hypothetical protein